MKKLHYIYGLKDPITDEIRYIGQTSQSLYKRWKSHLHEANRSTKQVNRRKDNWINSLRRKGLYPLLVYLDRVEDWNFWEKYYISKFSNLTNLTRGGFDLSKSQKLYIKKSSKPVYSLDIETLKVVNWKSVVEASNILDTSSHNICAAIHCKGKCCNKFWSYTPIGMDYKIPTTRNRKLVAVQYKDTFKIFSSVKESVENLGFKYSSIKNSVYKSLKTGNSYKGYSWKYIKAHIKLGELLESLEADNQQPSTSLKD